MLAGAGNPPRDFRPRSRREDGSLSLLQTRVLEPRPSWYSGPMLGREVLERLGQLNRGPLPSAAAETAPASDGSMGAPISTAAAAARVDPPAHLADWLAPAVVRAKAIRVAVAEHGVGAAQQQATGPAPTATASVVASGGTANALRGAECQTCWGAHWRIDQPLDELAPAWRGEWQRVAPLLPALGCDEEVHPEQRDFAGAFPQRTMYLDLETCGFAGSTVFLVGLVHHTPRGLVLTQLLARNYAEEKAMLESLWQIAAGHDVLVTFNGKSFDWPVVHDRSTLHHLGRAAHESSRFGSQAIPHPTLPGVSTWPHERPGLERGDLRPHLQHYDLLHHCRRRWRGTLPNCRLQTLERFICGRWRHGDIPGHLIPQAYHDYVRTGDTRRMHSILHHNALDLVTLLQLSLRVVATT